LNPALADSDADGLPDDWERLYGMDPLRNDAGGDADTDGRTALEEYLAGTNPGDSGSVFRLEVASGRPDGAPEFLRFEAVAGRSYRVERREDLRSGTWLPYARVGSEPVMHPVQLALPADDARSYYRVLTPDPEP